ncbi:MAG: hypothetical protein JNM84_02345 [Planctomycetes bacterium]|nr:hypothetical protein [Planctomycetota bacterium]
MSASSRAFAPRALVALLALLALLCLASCQSPSRVNELVLRSASELAISPAMTHELAARGTRTIVLRVEDRDESAELAAAARAIRAAKLRLGYWLEVARSPSLANAEPELMASLQGHEEWRTKVADAPEPDVDEVVKVWPWVPILTREGYDAQLARLRARLALLPPADELWLSGLQGAPSACGCGHPLCRWAADYHLRDARHPTRIPSGTPHGPDAAARFVEAVRALAPQAEVIPVWVAECAEDDALCHGVPCYEGRCWPALAEQWAPVVAISERAAVLIPSRSVGLPVDAARVQRELASLARIERRNAPRVAIDPQRLIAVVEEPLELTGAHVVAECELEQSWEPRIWPR